MLPAPPPAVGNYVGSVVSENLVFVLGHGPYTEGRIDFIRKVDSPVEIEGE